MKSLKNKTPCRLAGTHLLAVCHARACGQRLPGTAAQLAVVVPRAGLLAEGAGLAGRVLSPQPVVAVAGAQLREDNRVWGFRPLSLKPPTPPHPQLFTLPGARGQRLTKGAASRAPRPSCSRSGDGASEGHRGLGRRTGLVGPTGRGLGTGQGAQRPPLRLEGAGPGAGWPNPDARGSRRRGSSQLSQR